MSGEREEREDGGDTQEEREVGRQLQEGTETEKGTRRP